MIARSPSGAPAGRAFPIYTAAEVAADLVVHLVGLPAAAASVGWLIVSVWPVSSLGQAAAVLVYGAGLIGMLAASAAYNLTRPGPAKAVLRRLDHAMIFVMIAGTYTPFLLTALAPGLGVPLCGLVWVLAMAGVGLKLGWYHRVERASLALYLGMGWLLLLVIRPIIAALPADVLALLLAGGVVYSLGALVHARCQRVRFHNAIWHAMVLAAAALHFAAVARIMLESV